MCQVLYQESFVCNWRGHVDLTSLTDPPLHPIMVDTHRSFSLVNGRGKRGGVWGGLGREGVGNGADGKVSVPILALAMSPL